MSNSDHLHADNCACSQRGPGRPPSTFLTSCANWALVEAIRMRGYVETWRVRFHHDAYRMVYQVSRTRRHIVVTRMRPRPIAYEGMKH
jgi:hypothetical protein